MNDEHRDDVEEKEFLEHEAERMDEEVEEKKDEIEKEKEKIVLDQEERWKEIQERRAYKRLHAPLLPFPYKAVEKQL